MKHSLFLIILLSFIAPLHAQQKKVLVFEIKEEIAPSATRITNKALQEAMAQKVDLIVLHMNTFGGLLTDADSIRTAILNCPIPVVSFIDNNAASAGALISIACDRIYMRKGGNIGAATVVSQSGEALPDKYQSYMRGIMRSTAESHGKDTLVEGNDTSYKFKRDPMIAEAMVDPRTVVPGISDSGKVLTLTATEAISVGYCEGMAEGLNDVLVQEQLEGAQIIRVEKSTLDKFLGFITHPGFSSVLILIIIGGIYFELQSPGIGFPLLAAATAALLYFAPLYLEGLAANWEILLFIIGLVLIGLEIFVVPGFGVTGISGIILVLSSLVLSLIRNVNFDFSYSSNQEVNAALLSVLMALLGFVALVLLFGRSLMNSTLFQRIVLQSTLEEAKVSMGNEQNADENSEEEFIGHTGVAHSSLRPFGKIKVHDKILHAKTMGDFIDEGMGVEIIGKEFAYWIVKAR